MTRNLSACLLGSSLGAVLACAVVFYPWCSHAEPPTTVGVTQTTQTLAAATDVALTGTGPGLRLLCVQNIGTGLVNLAFGSTATAGQGLALNAAAGAGQGGGSMCWENVIPRNVVHAISTAGSSVVTLVGK